MDEHHSNRLQMMFFVYLRDLSFRLIRPICLVSILLIAGSYWFHFLEGDEIARYLQWQLIVSLFLGWIGLATIFSQRVQKYPNVFSFLVFGSVSFFTGYLLAPIDDPSGGLQSLIYFVPLYTIITPTNLTKRSLVTLGCFTALPGAMIADAWSSGVLMTVAFLVACMASLSILVGHGTFYKLNRENFFNQRQLAIQRQTIEQLAQYDQLTGLTERHVFEENLREEVAHTKRHGHSLTLLMIDLDHFKSINDTHGHQAGDAVLEHFGALLSSPHEGLLRDGDHSCRFGGEEFCVLLRETEESTARTVAERIRNALSEETFFGKNGEEFQATCSIGVASYDDTMEDYEELIRRADEKLYEAKESGRNRIIV